MRLPILLLFLALAAGAQDPPRIGRIDFYGARSVPEEKLRGALGAKEGDALPRSKSDAEERIEQVPGVVRAWLQAACCEDGQAILYIGIEEKGAPHFDHRLPPTGLVTLPEAIHDEYTGFLAAVGLAARAGETAEDLSQGHSLMASETVRKHQFQFVEMAKENLPALRDVLRNSGDGEQRAIAAYVIGYAPKKQDVIDDLQFALRDPDDAVRNNAARALSAIAVLWGKVPARDVKVEGTWLVEMLGSLIWSDRTTAAVALVTLTETRDQSVLNLLKERALPALTEMVRWKHQPHALPAFILAGRIAGLPEKEIQDLWAKNDRGTLLGKLAQFADKKKN